DTRSSTMFPYTTLFRSKDETDFFRPHAVEIRIRNVGNVFALEPDLTGCRPVKAADQIYQCRLTRSGRPHDCQPFAGFHVQRDTRSEEHTSELQSPYDLV